MTPGGQLGGMIVRDDTRTPSYIAASGQTHARAIDVDVAVSVALEPGERLLHHGEMPHASPAKRSTTRRLARAVRDVTPSARPRRPAVDHVTRVHGTDQFGHFREGRAPDSTTHDDAIAFHAEVVEVQDQILLRGAGRAGLQGLAETSSFAAEKNDVGAVGRRTIERKGYPGGN